MVRIFEYTSDVRQSSGVGQAADYIEKFGKCKFLLNPKMRYIHKYFEVFRNGDF